MLTGAWTQDARREAASRTLQSPSCVFLGPGAGPFSSVASGEGRGTCPGQAPARRAPTLPRSFSAHLSRALCRGEKERVRSSMHMAPLFTRIKEGGHYRSLGSLLDTLWCH